MCTFQPRITSRQASRPKPRPKSAIKGYDQAVSRMKAANERTKASKEMRDYKPIGENY